MRRSVGPEWRGEAPPGVAGRVGGRARARTSIPPHRGQGTRWCRCAPTRVWHLPARGSEPTKHIFRWRKDTFELSSINGCGFRNQDPIVCRAWSIPPYAADTAAVGPSFRLPAPKGADRGRSAVIPAGRAAGPVPRWLGPNARPSERSGSTPGPARSPSTPTGSANTSPP